MELFYFPVSPYSHKVQLALALKGIECEQKKVLPFLPEERAAYRNMYPLGRIPVLKDGERFIPESSIIVEYLDGLDRGIRLIPSDPEQAREVRLKDRLVDNYLSGSAIALFFQGFKSESVRDIGLMDRCRHEIVASYKVVEKELSGKDEASLYFHGEQISMADLSLIAALRICYSTIPFDSYPAISGYYEKHAQMPEFKALEIEANETMPLFIEALSG